VRNKDLLRLKRKIQREDPSWNNENYLAFCLAVIWPVQISPEQSFLALRGKKLLVRPAAITEDLILKILIRIRREKGLTMEILEQEYNVNRYDLCWELCRYRREHYERGKNSTDIKRDPGV
jgi:hypothetical protein